MRQNHLWTNGFWPRIKNKKKSVILHFYCSTKFDDLVFDINPVHTFYYDLMTLKLMTANETQTPWNHSSQPRRTRSSSVNSTRRPHHSDIDDKVQRPCSCYLGSFGTEQLRTLARCLVLNRPGKLTCLFDCEFSVWSFNDRTVLNRLTWYDVIEIIVSLLLINKVVYYYYYYYYYY